MKTSCLWWWVARLFLVVLAPFFLLIFLLFSLSFVFFVVGVFFGSVCRKYLPGGTTAVSPPLSTKYDRRGWRKNEGDGKQGSKVPG